MYNDESGTNYQLVDNRTSTYNYNPLIWNAYVQNYALVNGVLITAGDGTSSNSAAGTPPQYQFVFDTIGQVIFRSIGHCRLPLRTIWTKGINESGDILISNTMTFAAALCAPIDPDEDGDIISLWDGNSVIYASGGFVAPPGWTPEDQALLAASIANMVVYPGTETQLPAPLIVADKGAAKTNAFRGIRYVIFIDYPIRNGIPRLSAGYRRNNEPEEEDTGAVEFLAGSG